MLDECVPPFLTLFRHVEEHGGVAGQLLHAGQSVVGRIHASLDHS